MKFIPILFSTPMVQAIIEGRKTQTRRVVKPQPPNDFEYQGTDTDKSSGVPIFYACWEGDKFHNVKSPYGQIGDILWVRETWREMQKGFDYKADFPDRINFKWKPSIFMPKAACRIFLEITNLRVERLQDISEADALAEGITSPINKVGNFRNLWQLINGEQSWNDNPFVWCIEFKRIEKPVNFI